VKEGLPKQVLLQSLNPLWYGILAACSFVFLSCNHQPPEPTIKNSDKKSLPINNIEKDGFAPPKVTFITSANLPRAVKAGKAVIRLDSSNGGTPFFTNYGTEQGLPISSVLCSLEDGFGNLWFGTNGGGVSRYDGKSFSNFTTAQGLAGNVIWCIIQDSSGNIWFGTDGDGASRYDGKGFTNFTAAQGLVGNNVRSIIQDKSGNLWFATYNGVSKYNGKTFTNYTVANGLPHNYIYSIMRDKSDNLWFATGRGASWYNNETFMNFRTSQELGGKAIRCIIQDVYGRIWFAIQGGGAIMYDGKNFTKYTTAQGLVDNRVYCIMQDRSGGVWFGTEGGVSRYDGKTFTNYTTSAGLPDNVISNILQDRSGNIWFCTFGGGVSRYEGKSFTNYRSALGLTGDGVFCIMQERNGILWFGTYGGGASSYDGKSFANYSTQQGLVSDEVNSIFQDNTGNIWFGTSLFGVCKYDGKSFTNYTTAQGLAGNRIFSIMQDNTGGIWFGTDSGASRYDSKSFTNFTKAQGLAGNVVSSIMQDNAGGIWFGTDSGASRYESKSFTNFAKAQGLAGDFVSTLIQDRSGNIWFGTSGGVSKYDGKTFTNIITAQGLADNGVGAIAEDTIRHIIWFGTNLGLSGFGSVRPSNGANQVNRFEIFNENTGYHIKDANLIFLDNRGMLWVGCGDNKLIRFDYDSINRNLTKLALKLQSIKVNNQDICWNIISQNTRRGQLQDSMALINEMVTTFGNILSFGLLDTMRKSYGDIRFDSLNSFYPVPVNLVLPYNDNNITIDFVAIETVLPKQVRYQYKLDGYDKDWSPLSNRSTAVFGNIPEGSYTLRLKALSPYGIWSETEYKFKVLPPWYRSWWAYIIYILFFIATIWSFIYYRSKQLRRKNRILEEKISYRTEQLKQSLENLKSTQAQLIQSEKMASLGELTAGIAHEIQNPLNFVNNFSDVNEELLEELKNEADKGNIEEVKAIAIDVISNEQKINHHGKRADAIVKGMLQHSLSSKGVKESTDINALADEYLRLSYHGLRAREKGFNATMYTDFDNSIGKINIIPQDIGRALLNLYNNAFYAVSEKKKSEETFYEPAVSVTTKKADNKITISVRDNGNGIPKIVVDKIFQPFFTTKPTGQGTGLGLSMSYDIVKAHSGEIKVETKENEGCEFTMELPLK
jgi:ligand-binding sensor domain-containing protein/signal transduction histidine kinase